MQFVKENFLAEPVWFPLKVLLLQIFFFGRHTWAEMKDIMAAKHAQSFPNAL